MRSLSRFQFLMAFGLVLAFSSCWDRAAEEEAEAQAKAMIDSVQAAAAVADTVPKDSAVMRLDSGVWHITDTLKEDAEEEDEGIVEDGAAFERWKRVSDDTVAMERRQFDKAKLDAYLQDPDLDYDRVIHHDNLWWYRFTRWLSHQLDKLFGTRGGRAIFNNLHWIVLGMAVFFVAWYFRRNLFGGVFAGAAKHTRMVTEIEENIEELDLDALLRDAENAKKWKLALRYQWLKVLRRLVDEGLINWQPRFTDADYLAQLKEPAMRASFSELSFLFKWVWYGDAPMDEVRYHRLKPAFEAMHAASPLNKNAPKASATAA